MRPRPSKRASFLRLACSAPPGWGFHTLFYARQRTDTPAPRLELGRLIHLQLEWPRCCLGSGRCAMLHRAEQEGTRSHRASLRPFQFRRGTVPFVSQMLRGALLLPNEQAIPRVGPRSISAQAVDGRVFARPHPCRPALPRTHGDGLISEFVTRDLGVHRREAVRCLVRTCALSRAAM